jgi:hypothetical protein
MIRPMTSNVSALSSIVANGHQAIHFVSSAPSKIPYGGFSPVRLQTDCQPRPSPPRGGFDATTVEISSVRVLFRNRAFGPAAPTASDTTHPPSGPWLRRRLCCPPASSLTMATSELLPRTAGFVFMADGSLATQKVPTFISQSLMTCRCPYSDGSRDVWRIPSRAWPSPIWKRFGNHVCPHTRLRVVVVTKLQHSLYAAARHLASPALDGTFTAELAQTRSLQPASAMTTRAFVSPVTGLSPAALSALWAALQIQPLSSKVMIEIQEINAKKDDFC